MGDTFSADTPAGMMHKTESLNWIQGVFCPVTIGHLPSICSCVSWKPEFMGAKAAEWSVRGFYRQNLELRCRPQYSEKRRHLWSVCLFHSWLSVSRVAFNEPFMNKLRGRDFST